MQGYSENNFRVRMTLFNDTMGEPFVSEQRRGFVVLTGGASMLPSAYPIIKIESYRTFVLYADTDGLESAGARSPFEVSVCGSMRFEGAAIEGAYQTEPTAINILASSANISDLKCGLVLSPTNQTILQTNDMTANVRWDSPWIDPDANNLKMGVVVEFNCIGYKPIQ